LPLLEGRNSRLEISKTNELRIISGSKREEVIEERGELPKEELTYDVHVELE
jgi:hypothetical protein